MVQQQRHTSMILVKPLVFMFDTNNYSSKMKIKNTAYVRRAPKFNKKKMLEKDAKSIPLSTKTRPLTLMA